MKPGHDKKTPKHRLTENALRKARDLSPTLAKLTRFDLVAALDNMVAWRTEIPADQRVEGFEGMAFELPDTHVTDLRERIVALGKLDHEVANRIVITTLVPKQLGGRDRGDVGILAAEAAARGLAVDGGRGQLDLGALRAAGGPAPSARAAHRGCRRVINGRRDPSIKLALALERSLGVPPIAWTEAA